MTLKLAHISDVHLGAKFSYLGDKAEEHRNNLKNTMRLCVDKAIENEVDLFIVAGDIFDQPFPSKLNQLFVLEQIKRLIAQNIYVAIISGNHDRNELGSVFNHSPITQFRDVKFRLFNNEKQEAWLIGELATCIVASGCQRQKSKNSPYQRLVRDERAKFNVGIFHGSADVRNQPDNYPIYLKDLYASKFDYIALGDWHNQLDLSREVPIMYSGSPEIVDSDQDKAGYMIVATLVEGQKAKLESVRVGSRSILAMQIDLTQLKSLQGVLEFFKTKSDKSAILNLKLTGFRNIDSDIHREDLLNGLSELFYHVNIADETKFVISEKEMMNYSDSMVIGRYIKLLQDQKTADVPWNRLVDEAMQLGVHLLKGGRL